MTELERRTVHLLVPDADCTRLLIDAEGRLPILALEFDPTGTTATAVAHALRERDLDAAMVDCFIDQSGDAGDGPVPVVVELELFGGGMAGTRWASLDDVVVEVSPALRPYVDARVAEWRGAQVPPATRSPWVRRGWFAQVCAWIDLQLEAAGFQRSTAVVPFRMWGISAVLRVTSPSGTFWFKAVYPGFAAEPWTTQRLQQLRPGTLPDVVAIEPDEGWLLTAHVQGVPVAFGHQRTAEAVAALVALQRELAGHCDVLLDAGVPDRRLHRLAADVRDAAARPAVRTALPVDDARIAELARGVSSAADRVLDLGFEDTIVHGDFHASNVMVDGSHAVIFDWSDAAVSHPLVDIGAWASWFREEPEQCDALWAVFADRWSPVVPASAVLAARPVLAVVVAAYHFVSYAHIAEGLEPLRQGEALSGVHSFFGDLDAAFTALAALDATM